jgi:hypothetical protein
MGKPVGPQLALVGSGLQCVPHQRDAAQLLGGDQDMNHNGSDPAIVPGQDRGLLWLGGHPGPPPASFRSRCGT